MDSSLFNFVGIASLLTLTSPLELVRTRLQTDRQLVTSGKIRETYRSIRHCLSSIKHTEGVSSLWKGNTVGLLRFFPSETINFKARSTFRQLFRDDCIGNVAVAVLAGWTASSVLYPLETIRMALSTNTSQQKAIVPTLTRLVRQNGFSIFYRGFTNSMLGTAIFRGSFNGLYDWTKGFASSKQGKIAIAYGCSVIASAICYPMDSLRRKQIICNSKDGMISFGRKVVSEEGIKGLYRGSHLLPIQSVIGALILLVFDTPSTADN